MQFNAQVLLPLSPQHAPARRDAGALRRQMRRLACAAALMASMLWACGAQAAGGHHAVDDAALLEPGQCQVELWQERSDHDHTLLNHAGPACRWGALEWGLNLDEWRWSDHGRQRFAGPQVKWATPITKQLSAGVAVGSTWATQDLHGHHYTGTTLIVPVTWQATEAIALHANVGWDQHPHYGSSPRRALAAEWSPGPDWSLVAERFDDHGERHWRAGARYLLSDQLSLDVSRAAFLGPATHPWWAFGLNWTFSPGAR